MTKPKGIMLTRRSLIASAAVLPFIGRLGYAADRARVRFGVLYPNLTTVIHEIALKTGAYERQGLDIEETRFKSGQTVDGVNELWRGNLDFYMGGAPEIPRLNSRLIEDGKPAALSVVSGANPGHTSLVLSNKLQPKSIDEILNQPLKIAVSSLSSVHLSFWRGYLQNEKKLDPNAVAWQYLPLEAGNMLPALLTNQIDGFLHSEPTTTLAIVNKAGHLFMQAGRGDMGPNPPPATFLSSRRDFLKDNDEVARRFMKAIGEANDAYKNSPKEKMTPLIAEWSGQKEEVVAVAYERMNPVTAMTQAQAEKWWNIIGTTMVVRGELSPKVDPFRDVFQLDYQASV